MKEGDILEELPDCENCKKQVSGRFLLLAHESGKAEDLVCCSKDCIDELHKKITGKEPNWKRVNSPEKGQKTYFSPP